jgi:hypothetical protein
MARVYLPLLDVSVEMKTVDSLYPSDLWVWAKAPPRVLLGGQCFDACLGSLVQPSQTQRLLPELSMSYSDSRSTSLMVR